MKIPVENRKNIFPASFQQEGIWFHAASQGTAYWNFVQIRAFTGYLDQKAIEQAIQSVLIRHSALCTNFYLDNDKLWQMVNEPVSAEPLTRMIEIEQDQIDTMHSELLKQIQTEQDYEFDFEHECLVRFKVVKFPTHLFFILNVNHIVTDSVSMQLIWSDLISEYNQTVNGTTKAAVPATQYHEYATWQSQFDESVAYADQQAYWMKKVSVELPFLNLSMALDNTRSALVSSEYRLDNTLVEQIRTFSFKNKVIYSAVLQLAYVILLHRYSDSGTVVIGNVVNGRGFGKRLYSNVVGLFAKRLVNIVEIDGSESILELLQKVNQELLDSFTNSDYPYEHLLRNVNRRDNGRMKPLFNAVFNMIKASGTSASFTGLTEDTDFKNTGQMVGDNQYGVGLSILDYSTHLTLRLDIAADEAFSPVAEMMLQTYVQILKTCVSSPYALVAEIDIITPETNALLIEFNQTMVADLSGRSILQRFIKSVELNSGRTALTYLGISNTYQDLDAFSGQLYRHLKSLGVKKDDVVAICLGRVPEMIISMLGVLKAGAAYLPVDPAYPEERIAYMLSDTLPIVIVTTSAHKKVIPAEHHHRLLLVEEWYFKANAVDAVDSSFVETDLDDIFNVIYTSGSTGNPKGVMIPHRGILNLINWHTSTFRVSSQSKATVLANVSFDAFGWEIWPYLTAGATLNLIDEDLRKDPIAFFKFCAQYEVTHCFVPTPLVGEFVHAAVQQPSFLQFVLTGGDRLVINLPKNLTFNLVNNYGPTENSVVTTSYIVPDHVQYLAPPIGKPIDNQKVYILSARLKQVPIGVAGKLYVEGYGLAKGYLNRFKLTADSFIINPDNNQRLYCTGDICRWLPDGNIEYIGRDDDQIKIRGNRIELGEIMQAVQQYPGVEQTVVLCRNSNNATKNLIGYVKEKYSVEWEELRTFLALRLPDYMIPQLWLRIQEFPLTPNGKIDLKQLPDPKTDTAINAFTPPVFGLELLIINCWKNLLQLQQIGIHHNFFTLGGDSIIAIQLVSRLRQQGYDVQAKDIFQNPTVKALATVLEARISGPANTAEQGKLSNSSGLLPIQQWYFDQERYNTQISHFNQSLLLAVPKTLSRDTLAYAAEKLVLQHDALRFQYSWSEGHYSQIYGAATGEFSLCDLNVTGITDWQEQLRIKAADYQKGLDISTGKLFKMVCFLTPDEEPSNRLLLIIHHLAVDGVSWRILSDDLETIFEASNIGQAANLGYKSSSYRQWYQALEIYAQSNRLLAQQSYWKKIQLTSIPLPKDYNYKGRLIQKDLETVSVSLTPGLTDSLLHICPSAYVTEINDLLLSALTAVLTDWCGGRNLVIGLEGHGREEAIAPGIDLSKTVGWFTSIFPFRLEAGANKETNSLIRSVKENLRRIPDKGLGYGVLRYLKGTNDPYMKESWEVTFNYLGQVDNSVKASAWLNNAEEDTGQNWSTNHSIRELIAINVWVRERTLQVNWEFSTRHYKRETIQKLTSAYHLKLLEIIDHCSAQAQVTTIFSPADFGLGTEVGLEEFDAFLVKNNFYIGDRPQHYVERPISTNVENQLEAICKLTPLQSGMLFHHLYDKKSKAYTEQYNCNLYLLRPDVLIEAWRLILNAHSGLRAVFFANDFKVPVQCILHNPVLPVNRIDFSHLSEIDLEKALSSLEAEDRNKGFDLAKGPLMRLTLISMSRDRYRMIWTVHHLLVDGWSIAILIDELKTGYGKIIAGEQWSPAEDRFQDFIHFLNNKDRSSEEDYWRAYLQALQKPSLLPQIKDNVARSKGIGSYQESTLLLDAEFTGGLLNYAQQQQVTVNTVMQAAWAYLLYRYSGDPHVVFGVTVSGRPVDLADVESRVGLFINTIPLYTCVSENQLIREWLNTIQEGQIQSRQFQFSSLNDIQRWIGFTGDLFDTLMVFENYPVMEHQQGAEAPLEIINSQIHEQVNYPLSIRITVSETTAISFNYNASLLAPCYLEDIKNHFSQLLSQVVFKKPEATGDMAPPEIFEKQLVNLDQKSSTAEPAVQHTLLSLFAQQVIRHAGHQALIVDGIALSYRELDQQSNQLAHYLRKRGVNQDKPVGICIDPSPGMIIGILGIMKAGGAYVPVDPEYPLKRINYISQDTGFQIIVSVRKYGHLFAQIEEIEHVLLDEHAEKISVEPNAVPEVLIQPTDLAYIIYTSGSTGQPKGVMVEHRNVVAMLNGFQRIAPALQKQICLSLCSFVFDVSVWEFFNSLCYGHCLHLLKPAVVAEPQHLANYIASKKISCAYLPPLLLPAVLAQLRLQNKIELKRLLVGVMSIRQEILQQFLDLLPDLVIINGYGPTETAICATFFKFIASDAPNENTPIGRAVPGYRIYLRDVHGKICPAGVPGEICVAGPGVGRGYWNNAALTSTRFLPDVYGDAEERMYCTGDVARQLPDGNLEYIGRKDNQVKVRGYRIELEEIESVLHQSGMLQACAVSTRENADGNLQLWAYLVAGPRYNERGMRRYLTENLPIYMIPDKCIQVENLPVTTSGKIDRNRLPESGLEIVETTAYTIPNSALEHELVQIWQMLLGLKKVGTGDNFFALGGHSLLAMQLSFSLERRFHESIPVRAVFEYPTVAELAIYLDSKLGLSHTGGGQAYETFDL